MARAWALDQALPQVNALYPELEALLGVACYFPLPTCRLFRSAEQRDAWNERPADELVAELDISALPFEAPWGGVSVTGGGWLDLPLMLDALKARRQSMGEWGAPDGGADITVWAEGGRAAVNPLWSDIGWRNVHGDVLTLKIPTLPEDRIYSFGKFLLPLGHSRFRCGATYVRDLHSSAPTEAGRDELVSEVDELLTVPFDIEAHAAGVRPVTVSRQPIAGPHPDDASQWILNGFGSKGVLYVPWVVDGLLRHITSAAAMPGEVWAPRRIQRQRDRQAGASAARG